MSARRGKGEGAISCRKDGRWVGIVDLGWRDGKRARKYVYGKTRAEVTTKLHQAIRQRDAGLLVPSDQTTVEEFLSTWLESAQATNRPSTWQRYKQYVGSTRCR